jgi:hypothetical protein
VSIPIALKTFFRVVLVFQPKEFCELRVVAFHLVSSRIAMVYEVVRACATCCHIDQPLKGMLGTLEPFGAVNCMQVEACTYTLFDPRRIPWPGITEMV